MKKTCQRCKGSGTIEAQLLNHGKCDYVWAIFDCDDCCGKGYRIDEPKRVYAAEIYRNERPYGEPINHENLFLQ